MAGTVPFLELARDEVRTVAVENLPAGGHGSATLSDPHGELDIIEQVTHVSLLPVSTNSAYRYIDRQIVSPHNDKERSNVRKH